MRTLVFVALAGCGSGVSSDEEARWAYLGLDTAIEKSLNLGMDGYNAASSANIPDQTGDGDVSGTITISGQVDQGSSDNKGMRLAVSLVDYSDVISDDTDSDPEAAIHYDTHAEALPALDLSLRDIPDGTFTGTFAGAVEMSGDLEGDVTLDVQMSGEIEPDPDVEGGIRRVVGTTQITGTATSDYGDYEIEVTR